MKSDLLLYTDDSCLVFQHKHITEIETYLNNDFSYLCQWLLYNKLSICFGDDKTKSMLFVAKHKLRKAGKLKLPTHQGTVFQQNSQITYLGCIVDETISRKPRSYKTTNKIISRLNFLLKKKHFFDAPAGIYLLKVNNRNTRTRCEICSKLTIKTLLTLNIFHTLF